MEKHISLFSRERELEKIIDVIMKEFGMEKSDGNNTLHLENNQLNITIDIIVFTYLMGDQYKQVIEKQKKKAITYFSQIQNCNDDKLILIDINLFNFIQQSKSYILITITTSTESNFNSVISTILKTKIDKILITNNGQTALNSEGKIILSNDGQSELEYYFPFEVQENSPILENCSERQISRRTENMKFLFSKRIYCCELPMNDDDDKIKLRSHEDVVKRTIGTLIVSLYSEFLLNPEEKMSVSDARNFIQKVMNDFSVEKLDDVLTEEELSYINNDDSEISDRINYSWHYENLFVLEWILGLTEWNFPDKICDVKNVVRNLQNFHSIEEFCKKTVMRSKKEILDKADLIYRMDWAAVDARIQRLNGPAGLDHGVVQERHKTLNWMICFDDADWDDVPTPT